MLQKLLADYLPKIAVGLLVPLLQFLWTRLQDQRHEHRKARLRKQVADLSVQRESLTRSALRIRGVQQRRGGPRDLRQQFGVVLQGRPENRWTG